MSRSDSCAMLKRIASAGLYVDGNCHTSISSYGFRENYSVHAFTEDFGECFFQGGEKTNGRELKKAEGCFCQIKKERRMGVSLHFAVW